jgi:hypothetical protein
MGALELTLPIEIGLPHDDQLVAIIRSNAGEIVRRHHALTAENGDFGGPCLWAHSAKCGNKTQRCQHPHRHPPVSQILTGFSLLAGRNKGTLENAPLST